MYLILVRPWTMLLFFPGCKKIKINLNKAIESKSQVQWFSFWFPLFNEESHTSWKNNALTINTIAWSVHGPVLSHTIFSGHVKFPQNPVTVLKYQNLMETKRTFFLKIVLFTRSGRKQWALSLWLYGFWSVDTFESFSWIIFFAWSFFMF